mmetsp:Transcript_49416/g.124233  ORF Transcript_49416/g.124233 Transcript_49416/m.124233 type:complete len:268 (-) Transcript_49416:479-1282(-)
MRPSPRPTTTPATVASPSGRSPKSARIRNTSSAPQPPPQPSCAARIVFVRPVRRVLRSLHPSRLLRLLRLPRLLRLRLFPPPPLLLVLLLAAPKHLKPRVLCRYQRPTQLHPPRALSMSTSATLRRVLACLLAELSPRRRSNSRCVRSVETVSDNRCRLEVSGKHRCRPHPHPHPHPYRHRHRHCRHHQALPLGRTCPPPTSLASRPPLRPIIDPGSAPLLLRSVVPRPPPPPPLRRRLRRRIDTAPAPAPAQRYHPGPGHRHRHRP